MYIQSTQYSVIEGFRGVIIIHVFVCVCCGFIIAYRALWMLGVCNFFYVTFNIPVEVVVVVVVAPNVAPVELIFCCAAAAAAAAAVAA